MEMAESACIELAAVKTANLPSNAARDHLHFRHCYQSLCIYQCVSSLITLSELLKLFSSRQMVPQTCSLIFKFSLEPVPFVQLTASYGC